MSEEEKCCLFLPLAQAQLKEKPLRQLELQLNKNIKTDDKLILRTLDQNHQLSWKPGRGRGQLELELELWQSAAGCEQAHM